MKTRIGFVSNSSSSSFIITNNKFPTIMSLASYMIQRQIEDSEYDNDSWSKEYIIRKKKHLSILKDLDENSPVSFSSCNYDTYIRKIGDCYLVNTCNNTDWKLDNYNVKLTESAINELKKLKIQYKGTKTGKKIKQVIKQKYDEFPTFGNDFYSLDEEIEGIETYDYCNNHEKSYMYPMWDTLKYGKICLDCHPHKKRLQRREKLNKINQSIVK